MKQMNLWQKIMLLVLLLTQVFMLTPVYAGGNDWVNGWLRADTFDIYNNTDYKRLYSDLKLKYTCEQKGVASR